MGDAASATSRWRSSHEDQEHVVAALAALKPECRCLVPANSAEYAPEPNPETKKKDVVWFAFDEYLPLLAFAGHLDRV
jgi:putative SOS response-associated peptidase YedK